MSTSTARAIPTLWGETPVSPREPGIRILRGKHYVFVPDRELLDLANTIADYLAGTNNTTEPENR